MTMTEDTFTSREARLLVGCSHRVLDYFVRCDLIHPALGPAGSGSRMAWGLDDVRILAVFVALRRLGACHDTLEPLEAALRRLSDDEWTRTYVVTVDGALRALCDDDETPAGWLVDLGRLLPVELATAA